MWCYVWRYTSAMLKSYRRVSLGHMSPGVNRLKVLDSCMVLHCDIFISKVSGKKGTYSHSYTQQCVQAICTRVGRQYQNKPVRYLVALLTFCLCTLCSLPPTKNVQLEGSRLTHEWRGLRNIRAVEILKCCFFSSLTELHNWVTTTGIIFYTCIFNITNEIKILSFKYAKLILYVLNKIVIFVVHYNYNRHLTFTFLCIFKYIVGVQGGYRKRSFLSFVVELQLQVFNVHSERFYFILQSHDNGP